MKKTLVSLIASALLLSALTACGESAPTETAGTSTDEGSTPSTSASSSLVVYSPNSDGLINATIPLFEETYGVEVEIIQAGTGELIKRIQSESSDPYGDVMFGGSWSLAYDNKDLWEEYVSANNDGVIADYQNTVGFITGNVLDGSCIIVNTDLIGDIQVESYADLLNPALKGQMIAGNPSNSSSAFAQLTNMLLAMGGYEDEAAWQYVEDLYTNLDGRVSESSSTIYKSVADGEAIVGLSYEDPCADLVRSGAPVEVVYPSEGAVYLPAGATIIKDAKNMENAKLFMDFIVSEEVQNIWGSTLTNRPVYEGATTSDFMTPMSEINVIVEDIPYVSTHKDEIVTRFTDLYADIQSN